MKILILGGYGTFGGRLAQLLAGDERLTLIIAGRSRERAQAFCQVHASKAAMQPAVFDRDGDVEDQLRALAPDLVVDATGPFQVYDVDPYRVIAAAVALGINYLDLADGSEFVDAVAHFDTQAQARGIFILSGVSSFPVLTAAVVRSLSTDLARIDTITGGIAPSPHARVGINVIRAIASYAGKRVPLRRDGRDTTAYALVEAMRYTIGCPGSVPLAPRRFSLVDVPDLRVLPKAWPQLKSVWIGAGPVPEIWHRALNAFAWAVRMRLLPSLLPLAGLMRGAIETLRWGEHRGGMFVSVEGVASDGTPVRRAWHLVVEGEDGPFIPSMAAAGIIRRCLAGRVPTAGARPGIADLELDDYETLFTGRSITTGRWDPQSADDDAPLYKRLLGEAWHRLPDAIRAMHEPPPDGVAEGSATVERGSGLLARLVAWVFRFPETGSDVPVKVRFEVRDRRETWTRTFGVRSFASKQHQGEGRFERLVCESFGPFTFGMAVVVDGGRLRLVVRRWSAFGIPMPAFLAPRGDSYEHADDGRFHFQVEIALPLVGPIVTYRGWLVPRW